jgi:hypothetical protein
MTKTSSSNLLDWTITDAPPADEPLPSPDFSPSPRRTLTRDHHLSVLLWLIVGSLIAVVIAGLWVFSTYNTWRTRRDVMRVATLEEKAAWAGDMRLYLQLSDDSNPDWVKSQTRLVENNQSAPAPLPGLRPSTQKTILQSVESLTPDTVRVDAVRAFRADDGTALTFMLPQFYRYTRGAWRRIPPPDIFWGEPQNRSGAHASLRFYTADAPIMKEELGPYLDDVLARACAVWACPAHLVVGINFANTAYQPGDALMSSWFGENIFLPSPHAQGLPAAAAAKLQLKRTVAWRSLFALGDLVVRRDAGLGQPGSAFFHAFMARTALQLGVITPHMETAPSASTLYTYTPIELWCAYCGASITQEQVDITRWEAEALLNELLRDQPTEKETALFQALSVAIGPVSWVAKGLGISSQEAQARLDAAFKRIQPAPR